MDRENLWKFIIVVREFSNKVLRSFDYFLGRIEAMYKFNSNIKPFKIYYVDPNNIEKFAKSNSVEIDYFDLSPVISGDWDLNTHDLSDSEIFTSFEEHFQKGISWEETDLYRREVSYLNKEKEWANRKFSNKKEIKSYLKDKDKLFKKIKQEGYKTQRDLNSENETSSYVPKSKALERNEITVHIGRKGEIILGDGFHRLAISQILEIDKVPVRIAARHSKWQEKRKKSMNSNKCERDNHPDLTNLQ